MNKEKQIEEMAKTVCHLDRTCDQCMTSFECKAMTYAKRFYNAGYRKASEIFEEIEKQIDVTLSIIQKILNAKGGRANGKTVLISKLDMLIESKKFIAELKKKYTEEGK